LYGFVALRADFDTIHGLTFYKHGETPGLGGEVDNPRWRAKWADRKVFDENFDPAIRVIKGPAGPPEEAPFEVDGLSGATITSNGVTYLMQFWLGEDGFGPYLEKLRSEGGAS
jgi:Na+-transporting NADH:ubiquinone oxidoreductase subunit C